MPNIEDKIKQTSLELIGLAEVNPEPLTGEEKMNLIGQVLKRNLQDYTKQVISEALPKFEEGYVVDKFEVGFAFCKNKFIENLKEQGIIIE